MDNVEKIKTALKNPKESYYCSFCGLSDKEVSALVKGKFACICDDCISVSVIAVFDQLKKSRAALKGDEG